MPVVDKVLDEPDVFFVQFLEQIAWQDIASRRVELVYASTKNVLTWTTTFTNSTVGKDSCSHQWQQTLYNES